MKSLDKIKLIATDLDGTFLNNESEISDYNKKVFQYLMNNGIEIILSTGRPFNGMQRYKNMINNDNYSIVFNGAIIADTNGKFIYNKVIDEVSSRGVANLVNKYKVYLHVYSGNKYIVSEPDFYYERYIEKENITDTIIGLDNVDNFEFSKMVFIGEREELLRLQSYITSHFNVHTSFSHTNFLEVLANGINKGSALKWLCDKKGIKREEIIAFGDNYNDIEMIEYAGVGVAMYNGEEDVKKKADYVCLSNDENGVGEFLNKFLNLKIII
ncbi:Cof-type HAD-IIB family hydrolase [Brachyspira murdochii]|uniref:Cof-type HAD-IIB family hydrolase n=1 Tax=Brachyspira murdochii TaxID=84378 RepID=UPI003006A018